MSNLFNLQHQPKLFLISKLLTIPISTYTKIKKPTRQSSKNDTQNQNPTFIQNNSTSRNRSNAKHHSKNHRTELISISPNSSSNPQYTPEQQTAPTLLSPPNPVHRQAYTTPFGVPLWTTCCQLATILYTICMCTLSTGHGYSRHGPSLDIFWYVRLRNCCSLPAAKLGPQTAFAFLSICVCLADRQHRVSQSLRKRKGELDSGD